MGYIAHSAKYLIDQFAPTVPVADPGAHNGPFDPSLRLARRHGVFMWSDHHPAPSIWLGQDQDVSVQSDHREVSRRRRVRPTENGWIIEDQVRSSETTTVSVNWTFAPEVRVEQVSPRTFKLTCCDAVLWFKVDCSWEKVLLDTSTLVSPSFRVFDVGSSIRLDGVSNGPRPYVTHLERQG